MPKLLRAGLSEIHAVIGAQPANLALEVGPLNQTSLIVDEAVPDVDIGDPSPRRSRPIELVEVSHIAIWCRRIAGNPTHKTGTPFILSAAIMSSTRLE